MRLLVSGATATLRRYPDSPYLGALIVPAAGNRLAPVIGAGLPWAADNAAFTGFDPAAFCGMLARLSGRPGCLFVACPDVVGRAAETLALFGVWEPIIRSVGLPVALVAQDGAEALPVPWDRFDALFVGGSTDWKLGRGAAALVAEARRRGKWVHLGRCNTRKRFRHAFALGCDSVDGSGFSRWPDQRIPLALRWLRDLHGDHPLPDPHAGAAAEFFQGGLRGGMLEGPGWRVDGVAIHDGRFVVRAGYSSEPVRCPGCHRQAPHETRLRRHGTRTVRVADVPRHGRPVVLAVRRGRFRCAACGVAFCSGPADLPPGVRMTPHLLRALHGEFAGMSPSAAGVVAGLDRKTVRRARALRSDSRHSDARHTRKNP